MQPGREKTGLRRVVLEYEDGSSMWFTAEWFHSLVGELRGVKMSQSKLDAREFKRRIEEDLGLPPGAVVQEVQ